MRFNTYVSTILEDLEQDTIKDLIVYVKYLTGDSCNGQMSGIRKMSLYKAADYFYDDSKRVGHSIKWTAVAANDPDLAEPIAPSRWYFPKTKEEFIQRLEQGKPTCIVSLLDAKIFPLTDDMINSGMIQDGQPLLFIITVEPKQAEVIGRFLFD